MRENFERESMDEQGAEKGAFPRREGVEEGKKRKQRDRDIDRERVPAR